MIYRKSLWQCQEKEYYPWKFKTERSNLKKYTIYKYRKNRKNKKLRSHSSGIRK